ncbi:hypothetical protein C1H46_037044 [Malus baccata]|uniref:Uncharacterized protein n=1 Tax=Malus baccata TaxID=106549 RepID=A0A540KTB6_MALBA|nr:hypothetical protein C1H46_037044 [Malus baccata]
MPTAKHRFSDRINCFANMKETRSLEFDDVVVIDTDNEESDTTEVLDDSKDLTDDESLQRGYGQSVIKENVRCTPCENSVNWLMEGANYSVNKQRMQGSVFLLQQVEGSPKLRPVNWTKESTILCEVVASRE